ncbi:MAG: hypothetical protein RB191_08280, partial [Terriglobia bacterium]|nr:hypothetical protein [Terriglobia bacterium]
ENTLSREMLYVKGWPTRLLTDEEAARLAEIRTQVCRLIGIDGQFLDSASIHARYEELMTASILRKVA